MPSHTVIGMTPCDMSDLLLWKSGSIRTCVTKTERLGSTQKAKKIRLSDA